MFEQSRSAIYLAALKWKQGEARAVATAKRSDREDMAILFDMPPAGDYDHELGRTPTPTEHIRLFGPRLEKHCGSMPVFVDALRVDDARHSDGLRTHPLTELLERGRLHGGRPCPVTNIDRSEGYQRAVERFCRHHPQLPIAIRLTASQLEGPALDVELSGLLALLGCEPERVFLVIDFGAPDLHEETVLPFAELIAERLNELPNLYRWLNIAVLATAFPENIRIQAGQSKRFHRLEWLAYQSLCNMSEKLLRRPIFGDYALEYPGRYVTGKAQPTAQFRYTTPIEYLVHKGKTTKKPNGYAVIREVADHLVGEADFKGPAYSLGDDFVNSLANRTGGTGNASTWRWAWTDHHLTTVLHGLRELLGIPAREELVTEHAEQLGLAGL